MTSLRARAILPVLGLACIWAADTTAQPGDPCNANTFLGVCGLTNPNTFIHDSQFPEVGEVLFSVRSFNQFFFTFPVNYTITVEGAANGTNFLLSAPSGQAAISMDFTDSSGTTSDLIPNTPSTAFQGSVNAAPVSMGITLETNGAALLPDTYTGILQLSLQQGPLCFNCQSISNIELIIELVVAPEIRISGLSDMAIDANPSGLTEAQQTFCVYSQGGAPFGITAASGNGNSSFLLAGNVDQVQYETWVESLSAGGIEQLAEGQPSNLSWPGSLWDGCSGSGENMQISIRIQQNALANAVETSYTDTLTLTVELN